MWTFFSSLFLSDLSPFCSGGEDAGHENTIWSMYHWFQEESNLHCPRSNPNFPRYNIKCSGKHDTTWNIPRCITFFPLHFMLYREKSISFGTVWGQLYLEIQRLIYFINVLLYVHPVKCCLKIDFMMGIKRKIYAAYGNFNKMHPKQVN